MTRHDLLRRVLLGWVATSIACVPDLPEHRFRCAVDADCPSSWACDPLERTCRRHLDAPSGDAGADAGSIDASTCADPDVCGSGGTCSDGSCFLLGTTTPCAPCGGRCVDSTSDPSHCGRCGNTCGSGGECTASSCVEIGSGDACHNCGGTCMGAAETDAYCGTGAQCDSGGHCTTLGTTDACSKCSGTCMNAAQTAAFVADCGAGAECGNGGCVSIGTQIACASYAGTCTTPAGCASSGIACTGGYSQAPLPGAPGHPFSFTVTSSGQTVVDGVTGLEWQRSVGATTYTWANAKSYCDGLVLDGKFDWRLPSRIELVSIMDDTKANPSIDTSAFPTMPLDGDYWTASTYAGGANQAWGVNFHYGYVWINATSLASPARCVR